MRVTLTRQCRIMLGNFTGSPGNHLPGKIRNRNNGSIERNYDKRHLKVLIQMKRIQKSHSQKFKRVNKCGPGLGYFTGNGGLGFTKRVGKKRICIESTATLR